MLTKQSALQTFQLLCIKMKVCTCPTATTPNLSEKDLAAAEIQQRYSYKKKFHDIPECRPFTSTVGGHFSATRVICTGVSTYIEPNPFRIFSRRESPRSFSQIGIEHMVVTFLIHPFLKPIGYTPFQQRLPQNAMKLVGVATFATKMAKMWLPCGQPTPLCEKKYEEIHYKKF